MAEWESLYEKALADYNERRPVNPDGVIIVHLAIEASGAARPFTARRAMRLVMSDGSEQEVFCQWREFMG